MRNLKTFAIALAIMVGGSTFANSGKLPSEDRKSNSKEIAKLLQGDLEDLKKDLYGKVIFSLTEEGEIVVHSVLTKDEYVREYVSEKLKDQKLSGEQWEKGITYILPVKMKLLS